MELWDVYDQFRVKTGRTMERGSEMKVGDYHLVVHIALFNSKGQMLIQQRQPFKKGWSNKWDITVGGSAIAGDSSHEAAARELFEEIGYSVDLTHHRPIITIHFDHGFDDYYAIIDDVDIDGLSLQYEEVKCVRWATKDEILQLISEGCFIPYNVNLINLLFDMRLRRGLNKEKDF